MIDSAAAREVQNRREFRLEPGSPTPITNSRRRFVKRFFRSLGFDDHSLPEPEVRRVFEVLARVPEYTGRSLYADKCWEASHADIPDAEAYSHPRIDHWCRDWHRRGWLQPLDSDASRWPEGRRFAVCLTHDMDVMTPTPIRPRLRSIPHLGPAPPSRKLLVVASAIKAAARRFGPGSRPEPFALDAWLDVEAENGFRSSLFFMAPPGECPDWRDGFYRHDDRIPFDRGHRTIGEIMAAIAARGWDVGLHGSISSHASVDVLRRERDQIATASGHDVTTTRQHYLRCDVRYTPWCQEQAGLQADSTLGSSLGIEYRCGTGLPFMWYDLVDERETRLLEMPLIIHDITIFNEAHQDIDHTIARCLEVMEEVCARASAMTLLWHNNVTETSPQFIVYRTLLEEARHRHAWGCSLAELNAWWRDRWNVEDSPTS